MPVGETLKIAALEGLDTGQYQDEDGESCFGPAVIGLEIELPRELPRYDLCSESKPGLPSTSPQAIPSRARAEGRDGDAGDRRRRRKPQPDPARGDRRHVIVRTGRRIPGCVPIAGAHYPISVVRMAVGDAHCAEEWREGEGENEGAFRTEQIERSICHAVAEFSFRHAERTKAKVFSAARSTRGLARLRGDAEGGDGRRRAAARHPDVLYEPQLIDATFALLIGAAGEPLVTGAQPRRRHPERPRDPALRLDRRLRVAPGRVQRGLHAEGAHG